MRICLVSGDEALRHLVGQVVGPTLLCSSPIHEPPEADFFLWDVENCSQLAQARRIAGRKHVFLVDRENLSSFGEQLQGTSVCILLKPVSQPTLAAFINLPRREQAADPHEKAKALRSDRDALLQYVLQANLKLQEYDQDRTNFLARALHDVRSPLTALHGYCSLLLDGQFGPVTPRQAELLLRMKSSSQRLMRLTRGMFELSVEGRRQRDLQLQEGDIEGCVNQAVHELSSFFQEKKLAVATQIELPERAMFFESQQIEQVLVNLLENAVKFTPKGGEIEVRGYSVFWDPTQPDSDDSALPPNAYRLDIRDSGPGIQPALLPTIFEQYTSCSSSDRSGGGLGLAICKHIVNAHRGHIWATSSEGGAIFSVVLPFEPAVALNRRPPQTERASTSPVHNRFVGRR